MKFVVAFTTFVIAALAASVSAQPTSDKSAQEKRANVLYIGEFYEEPGVDGDGHVSWNRYSEYSYAHLPQVEYHYNAKYKSHIIGKVGVAINDSVSHTAFLFRCNESDPNHLSIENSSEVKDVNTQFKIYNWYDHAEVLYLEIPGLKPVGPGVCEGYLRGTNQEQTITFGTHYKFNDNSYNNYTHN